MAVDAYMYFLDYQNNYMLSESQIDKTAISTTDKFHTTFGFDKAFDKQGLFEVEDFSFDIEQTLNIGSSSSGSGAGKITFNPFSITRKIDRSSPIFYKMACSGTPFQTVALGARKAGGQNVSGLMYIVFVFKLVAVKTISWSYDDESPKETATFEYGGLFIKYGLQKPDGSIDTTDYKGGWNKVKNVDDTNTDPLTPIK